MKKNRPHRTEYLHQPGRTLSDAARMAFAAELREVAATCFYAVPEYQCLLGTREELSDKVITTARRDDGTLAGFCSAVLLPVEGIGDVLHLGLTCVRPDDRGGGMTHKLTSKLVIRYLLTRSPFSRMWVSNCACVLSSLGNVALNFENVFPSPFSVNTPSANHLRIGRAISARYRGKMAVNDDATFDEKHFVFRGSVRGMVFEKDADDRRFHHRNDGLNSYYIDLLRFDHGDEALQIGHVSLLSIFPYLLRRRKARALAAARGPVEAAEAA